MPEYLDPEIANEGEVATMPGDSGFQTPMEKPHIPDYSWLKPTDKLAKYFPHISGVPYRHRPWPAWLYHQTEPARLIQDSYTREDPPRLVKTATDQAKELGVVFRKSTPVEISQGFPHFRWDFTGEWRSTPYGGGPDPKAYGKTLPPPSQNEVIANAVAAAMGMAGKANNNGGVEMIGAVVAAVMAAMNVQKASAGVANASSALAVPPTAPAQEALKLAPEEEKAVLIKAAQEKNVKVDGRWTAERIKEELEKFVG